MSSECSAEKDCINGKCQNACPGPCGTASNCQVKNHRPVCTCPPKYAGIPYIACKKN
nr:unnamed protein product [Callosobruchus chinensis]